MAAMNLLEAMTIANIALAVGSIAGMLVNLDCPPLWLFLVVWAVLVAVFCYVGPIW